MPVSVDDAVFIFFVGALLFFAVVSNFLVILVVWKTKKMRNVTNILICNLSVSDIILGGIILPQNLHDFSHEEDFHEGRFLCKIAFACPVLCITTASYTLAMTAFERRNCIVDSLKSQVEIYHCKFIIPIIWVIAMAAAMPTIMEFDVREQVDNNGNITHLACNSNGMPYYYVVGNGIMLLFVTYLIPLSIILYNYLRIIQFVYHWKMFSNGQSSEVAVTKSIILQKKMRIIKMLIIVAVVFAVSWLPYFVTLIIGKVTGNDGSENVTTVIFRLKLCLAAVSTAYNVILYVIFNPLFRNGFKQFIPCRRKNKVGVEPTNAQNEANCTRIRPREGDTVRSQYSFRSGGVDSGKQQYATGSRDITPT